MHSYIVVKKKSRKKKRTQTLVGYRKIFEAWDALKNVWLVQHLSVRSSIRFLAESHEKYPKCTKNFPSYWFTMAPHCIRTHAHVHPTQIVRNDNKPMPSTARF